MTPEVPPNPLDASVLVSEPEEADNSILTRPWDEANPFIQPLRTNAGDQLFDYHPWFRFAIVKSTEFYREGRRSFHTFLVVEFEFPVPNDSTPPEKAWLRIERRRATTPPPHHGDTGTEDLAELSSHKKELVGRASLVNRQIYTGAERPTGNDIEAILGLIKENPRTNTYKLTTIQDYLAKKYASMFERGGPLWLVIRPQLGIRPDQRPRYDATTTSVPQIASVNAPTRAPSEFTSVDPHLAERFEKEFEKLVNDISHLSEVITANTACTSAPEPTWCRGNVFDRQEVLSIIHTELFTSILSPFHPAVDEMEWRRYSDRAKEIFMDAPLSSATKWKVERFILIDDSIMNSGAFKLKIDGLLHTTTTAIVTKIESFMRRPLHSEYLGDLEAILREAYDWNRRLQRTDSNYVVELEPSPAILMSQGSPFQTLRLREWYEDGSCLRKRPLDRTTESTFSPRSTDPQSTARTSMMSNPPPGPIPLVIGPIAPDPRKPMPLRSGPTHQLSRESFVPFPKISNSPPAPPATVIPPSPIPEPDDSPPGVSEATPSLGASNHCLVGGVPSQSSSSLEVASTASLLPAGPLARHPRPGILGRLTSWVRRHNLLGRN
ncbi:hypothetical protein DL93DRAFT_2096507 [Clavulina sp. PMI_390]|nr:hypothetical protein DL93DRAFT_2096507 [Clavulina sp. PMI_390]